MNNRDNRKIIVINGKVVDITDKACLNITHPYGYWISRPWQIIYFYSDYSILCTDSNGIR